MAYTVKVEVTVDSDTLHTVERLVAMLNKAVDAPRPIDGSDWTVPKLLSEHIHEFKDFFQHSANGIEAALKSKVLDSRH